MTPQCSEVVFGKRGCGIYRSPSGIPAIQARSPVASTKPGHMENKNVTFERYN